MLSSSVFSDDDHFRRRLDSINKEMQDIIERTAVEHDKNLCTTLATSLPFGITGTQDTRVTVPPLPLYNPTAATAPVFHSVLDEAAVRRIVSSEINRCNASFEQALSDTIGGVKASVNQRFEEAKRVQKHLAESFEEAAEDSRQGLKEVQNALRRVQRSSGPSTKEISKDLEEFIEKSTSEQTLLRDAIAALQNEARIDQQRDGRRVDELVRRHHDLVRNSLLELDAHAAGLRDELHCMVREKAQQASGERDIIQQNVAHLQGALEAMNDTVARWVSELQDLIEENLTRRSEMRSFQRDVNRLEMLLRSFPLNGRSPYGGDDFSVEGGVVEHEKETTHRKASEKVVSDVVPLEKFLALKEDVNVLKNSVENMYSKMRDMEETLHRLVDGRGIVPTVASRDNSGEHVPPSTRDVQEGISGRGFHQAASLMGGNFLGSVGHQFSSNVAPASTQIDPTQRARMMITKGMLQNHSSSFLTPLQLQQQQKHSHHHSQYQQQQMQEQHRGSGSPTQATSETCRSAGEGSNASPTQFTDPPPSKLDATSACHNVEKSPLPSYESLVASWAPTPPDSYVSERMSDQNGEERALQYVPAPTSDIESELDNKKMARLALD